MTTKALPAPADQRVRVIRGLTATRVATLPPGRHKDPGQRSLYLLVRRRKDGQMTRTWLHRTWVKGADSYLMIGHYPQTSLEKARDEIRQQRELLSKGIDPKRAAPRRRTVVTPQSVSAAVTGEDGHSVELLAMEFMQRAIRPERKCPQYVQDILDRDVLPEWKGRDARTIKAREVTKLLDKIVDRGSRVMANRTTAVLRQMFDVGIDREIVDANPVRRGKRPGGREKPRQRVLSDAELKAFLTDPLTCTRQPRLSHIITLLLLTAARRGELAQARWRDLDLDKGEWTIPKENSKTGEEAIIALSAWAVREFQKLKLAAGKSPWVLPGTDKAQHVDPKLLTRSPAKCARRFKKAGIAAFTLHDLRRTCRTGLGRLKVAQHVAELCLNHAQPGIVGTYDTHEYLDEKRAALELWAAHLEGLARA
jgi:integrase